MHPSKFFDECAIRTSIDTVEIYDEGLRQDLKQVHPKNFLKTKIELPVYEITLSYLTDKDNYKKITRYAVMDSANDEEYIDMWVDMFVRDYNENNPQHKMINCDVLDIQLLGQAVLPIGS